MSKIYLPIQDFDDYACYVVYNESTIRAYENQPTVSNNNHYVDFFINSHYLEKEGNQVITDTRELPLCFDKTLLTNDKYYRNDISHILIIVFFILLIMIVSFKVFARMFGRWLKV